MWQHKGSAYIVVLLLVSVLSVLALSIISIAMSDYSIAKSDDSSHDVYYIADGGATAALYEIKAQVKETYDRLKQEAETQEVLPVEQYIEQHFYDEILASYSMRIDFDDGEDRYSDVNVVFGNSDNTYTIQSRGHVKNAVSMVEVKAEVILGQTAVFVEVNEWKEVR
ncbi:hypothetical protein [Mahella australiensis]|uniref:Type 4 fimbrial biogenesis protein PilX N-terminal domain-containing protein n=1 Tax=Mahella australiensis (strain DSM 15567 / CIP 107919 / 50-1 BON) TaxID=697281 RepID=F3ZVH3_MAHA5|nr:hypothetical protein [Mahella australiensis]AEE96335.1 hypothetical protein Mahau_1138 [Mahella australiensis 50-1 BON]